MSFRYKQNNRTDLKFTGYMYEQIAHGSINQLPISSVCNAKCIFCSNNQNPFEIYRLGFRPVDEIKKAIELLRPRENDFIVISDSLPGRISEGEALLHPKIFEILSLIRRKFKTTIQCRTNGTMLTEDFVKTLAKFKPIDIEISYHSDEQEKWSEIFNLGASKYEIASNSFELLTKEDFIVRAAIVAVPKLVGYDDIEKTIVKLKDYVKEITFWPPGWTKYSDDKIKDLMNVDYKELGLFLQEMRKKHNVKINFQADPAAPLDFWPAKVIADTFNAGFKNALWMFSEAAYERADKILKSFMPFASNNHHSFMVKNNTYGGNITCSGLLMVNDFRLAIDKALRTFKDIDLVIIPNSKSSDIFKEDLCGENYEDLFIEFKEITIWDA